MQAEIRWCSGCAGDRLFEQPPCEDDHGEGCLDLACVECGNAIVLGHVVMATPALTMTQAA